MPSAYLDHAASTPMRPEAVAAMVDVLERVPGNPSGQHRWARDARRLLDDARDRVAAAVGADPAEIVFTSGGTEADNLAITGSVGARGGRPICLAIDHHAALEPVEAAGGCSVPLVGGPDRSLVDRLTETVSAVDDVAVISFGAANSELGLVLPAIELATAARAAAPRASVHVDAVAAAAWLDLRPIVAAADLVSLSGHKVGGPKGIGALVVRTGTPLAPVLRGGSQERELRAGTQDVAGAVALGVALEQAVAERSASVERVNALRARLRAGLLDALGSAVVETVAPRAITAEVLPTTVHLSCRGVHREALLFRLDEQGVAASAGSSCASGAPEPSHVVRALGIPEGLRDGSLRLTLGWTSTAAEVDHALQAIPKAIVDLRGTATEGPGA